MQGLESFAADQQLESAVRDQLFEKAYTYLEELGRNSTSVSLEVLANHLWPEAPDDLKTCLANEELQLSDGFVPDRRALKSLMKFKGVSTHWKLEFDRRGLRNGDINMILKITS